MLKQQQQSLHHLLTTARRVNSLRERGHPFNLPDFSTTAYGGLLLFRRCTSFIHCRASVVTGLDFNIVCYILYILNAI